MTFKRVIMLIIIYLILATPLITDLIWHNIVTRIILNLYVGIMLIILIGLILINLQKGTEVKLE